MNKKRCWSMSFYSKINVFYFYIFKYERILRFSSFHATLSMLSSRCLAENGHRIAKALNTSSVLHWGWLSTITTEEGGMNGTLVSQSFEPSATCGNWQSVFVTLTDRDMLVYDTAPWGLDGWTKPRSRIPLLMTRYFSSSQYLLAS